MRLYYCNKKLNGAQISNSVTTTQSTEIRTRKRSQNTNRDTYIWRCVHMLLYYGNK